MAKKRANGEGNIRKRKDGRWEGRYTAGHDPETGKPIYETPVSYWMPFTWQGHGFHDATWQPAFGGSLYQSLGSHGCVNMPLDQAANLFNMLSSGTPVVIHY